MRKSFVFAAAVEALESRRLLSAGDLDSTFGVGGRTTVGYSGPTDDSADAVVVLSDGKILVAGESFAADGVPTFSRYLASGQLDTTFGTNGRIRRTGVNTGGVLRLLVNGDGTFLALTATNVTAGLQPVLRYTAQGVVDPTWVGPGTGITGRSLDLVALGGGQSLMVTTNTLAKLAANGALDTTFGGGSGKVVFGQEPNFFRFNPAAAAVQSSGKIVVAGERHNLQSGAREPAVRRFNADGTLDTTFANAGQQLFILPSGATAPALRGITIQPSDQKIVLTGTNGTDAMAIRLPADGGADQTFGLNGTRYYNLGGSSDSFHRVAIQADGKYLFAGLTDYPIGTGSLPRPIAARVATSGVLDTTYAGDGVQEMIFPAVPNLYGFSSQVVLDASGRGVLVGTVVTSPHRTEDGFIARLTTSGLLDTTFAGDGVATSEFEGPQYLYGPYPSVAPDGSVYMGGSTRITAGGAVLAKLNAQGDPDFLFGQGNGSDGVRDYDFGGRWTFTWDTTVQDDGRVIAVGRVDYFDFATSWDYDALIARFNPDGSLDGTFGGGDGYVLADLGDDFEQFVQVVVQNDGKIVTRGQYRPTLPGPQLQIVARYLADGTPDPDFGGGDGKVDVVPAFAEGDFGDMHVTRAGRILLGGMIDFDGDRFLQQLTADGAPDTTFGVEDGTADGAVRLDLAGVTGQALLGVQINAITDEILIGGTIEAGSSDVQVVLTKLTRDGAIVSSYGTDGTAWSGFWNASYRLAQMVWTPDDKVLLGGTYQRGGSDTKDVMVMRMLSDTTPDPSFASGLSMATVDFGRSDDYAGMVLRPDGGIMVFTDTDALLNGPTLFGAARLEGDATGTISGLVFHDRNANASWDTGDSAVQGRTVFVDLDNDGALDAGEPSDVTNANGGYDFAIAPGSYVVRFLAEDGWTQTAPRLNPAPLVTVASGQVAQVPHLGVRYAYATITGHVFDDVDADGNRDAGEGPLVDRTVYLDANNNGVFDVNTETFAVTDTSGNYAFTNVVAGPYRVRSKPFSQWTVTAPVGGGYVDVTVGPGGTADLVNFGHHYNYGAISGTVFNDLDGDGFRDVGEGGLASRMVFIDNDNDGTWDSEGFGVPAEPAAMTDGSGNYTLLRLQAGSYRVRLVVSNGWQQTAPATPYQVDVVQGRVSGDVVFGARDVSSYIAGFVFNDLDSDGVRDANETNWLTGRTVWLDTNNNGLLDNGERSHVTNDSFQFLNVAPGTYYVRATVPTGWRQTVPANNAAFVVTVASQTSNVLYIGQSNSPGRIAGFVYDDLDADGALDQGENALLRNRVVYVDADNDAAFDAGERSFVTQADGYWFDNLTPGTYVIRTMLPAGWRQTSPASNAARIITVAAGQQVLGAHFGTAPAAGAGTVSGTVYHDFNGNGLKDTLDSGFSNGATVFLDADDDGAIDPGEQVFLTPSNGTYQFKGVPAATNRFRIVLPGSWVQTGPITESAITLRTSASQNVTGQNFFVSPHGVAGGVAGYVFDDVNNDGLYDSANEAGLVDARVFFDLNDDGAYQSNEPSTTVAGGGYYSLPLPNQSGSTALRVVPLPGYRPSTTADGSWRINVVAGETTRRWRMFGLTTVPAPQPQSPYNGSPFAVGSTPITIEAEHFDKGGEGVAYHDTAAGNGGAAFREDEDVDLKLLSGSSTNYRVNGTYAGEYIEYSIDVAAEGQYDLEFRVSSKGSNGSFHVEVPDFGAGPVMLTGTLMIPNTGSHDKYQTVTKRVFLTNGQYILRLVIDSNSTYGSAGNFDTIRITPAEVTPPPPPPTGGEDVTVNNTVAAYVRNGSYGNTNFGNDAALLVKTSANTGNTREGYLKFDVSTLPADPDAITGVKLRLYGRKSASGTNPNIAVFGALNTSWSETGLTWNNKPATSGAALATRSISSTSNGWIEWDITEFVKQARQNGQSLVTLALRATNVTDPWAILNSDDAGSNRPQLVAQTSGTTPPVQALVVSPDALGVPEGGSASFTVKLAQAPTTNVTVTVSKQTGSDADVNASQSTLTFTPANWNVAQTVNLSAANDADSVNGQAFFSVASSGLETVNVLALEADDDGQVSEPTIYAGTGAYVRDGSSANNNYGTSSDLYVKQAAGEGSFRETYIKFDLSSADSVTSAKLRLNGRISDTRNASITTDILSASNQSWTETGLTWNNRPAAGMTVHGSVTVTGTGSTWYEVDLTPFVQAEFAAGRKVITLVLRGDAISQSQVIFASDETSNGPQLIVL